FCFFFSSRRRHTRLQGDWSSDVCSSDLDARRLAQAGSMLLLSACQAAQQKVQVRTATGPGPGEVEWSIKDDGVGASDEQISWLRSEERRVGKECRCGWSLWHEESKLWMV